MYNTLERFVKVFSCLMCSSLTMEGEEEEVGGGGGRHCTLSLPTHSPHHHSLHHQ